MIEARECAKKEDAGRGARECAEILYLIMVKDVSMRGAKGFWDTGREGKIEVFSKVVKECMKKREAKLIEERNEWHRRCKVAKEILIEKIKTAEAEVERNTELVVTLKKLTSKVSKATDRLRMDETVKESPLKPMEIYGIALDLDEAVAQALKGVE